jgi:hypothetical protein
MSKAEVQEVEFAETTGGGQHDEDKIEKPLPHGHDDALGLFGGTLQDFTYSAKEAARVRMKLDAILLPMVSYPVKDPCCVYYFTVPN